MKPYKADEVVNELTNKLFSEVKAQFIKERNKGAKKPIPSKDSNKENITNQEGVGKIRPLTKKSIQKRKVVERQKPKRLKITDFVKIQFDNKWKEVSSRVWDVC